MSFRRAIFFFCVVTVVGCKTKSELRREQEMEKIKQEVSAARGDKADMEVLAEELRVEMSRLGNVVEEHSQQQRQNFEELKKEIATLQSRAQALEQRAVQEEAAAAKPSGGGGGERPSRNAYETGKRLFEEGKYDEAIDALKGAKSKKSEEGRKSHYLLAESLFSAKEYASAALEFAEYRKNFPKDPLVPNAVYRQANAFRSMGKGKEAKLFYQELIDKYPKSNLVGKAKAEMKKLKW